MTASWYGEDISFRIAIEAQARRRYGRHLSVELTGAHTYSVAGPAAQALVYRLDGLDVRGRDVQVPVEVRFRRRLPTQYRPLIAAEDYPLVLADRELESPHRVELNGLCLYAPWDPPELRWAASMGLLSLLDATADHLFREGYWREHAVWLGPQAPHGMPR
jgi:hypothetical protein